MIRLINILSEYKLKRPPKYGIGQELIFKDGLKMVILEVFSNQYEMHNQYSNMVKKYTSSPYNYLAANGIEVPNPEESENSEDSSEIVNGYWYVVLKTDTDKIKGMYYDLSARIDFVSEPYLAYSLGRGYYL